LAAHSLSISTIAVAVAISCTSGFGPMGKAIARFKIRTPVVNRPFSSLQ
jgi:hypothetical protein